MGETTITVDDETKARLDEYRRDGMSWDGFMNYLADELEAYAEQVDSTADATALGFRVMYGGLDEADVETLLDGTREDLLTELPRRVADELDDRRR